MALENSWFPGFLVSLFKGFSPEVPRGFADDPEGEEKVGDGVRGHGVAEAVLAEDEPLVGGGAQETSEPFVVREAEHGDGDEERCPRELFERHGEEIGLGDVAIDERTVESFFERRHDERGAEGARDEEERERLGRA